MDDMTYLIEELEAQEDRLIEAMPSLNDDATRRLAMDSLRMLATARGVLSVLAIRTKEGA